MQIYPFSSPIILDDTIFANYGGAVGTFTADQRQNSYLLAEMQVSKYIGTLLLPHSVTGTFAYAGRRRVITDYGYVNSILDVSILSKNLLATSCNLDSDSGCAYIYEDTFGYLDVHQTLYACRCSPYYQYPGAYKSPYQFQIAYNAGLPTGTANQPGILEALTIMAQIDLNEKNPGDAGMNESTGDIGLTQFSDLGYRGYTEKRKESSMPNTILGSSPKSNYAAKIIRATIRLARPILRV